ncbi:von Willebrand factor [Agrilus planipennis]|uniref:von Willebrand factor n=1 Tax=Agrilus planipennis TaxID=224129 RepID=A0A1W4X3L8_AGRPL|nr:von Willebrand factor [Agrilus planipennis]
MENNVLRVYLLCVLLSIVGSNCVFTPITGGSPCIREIKECNRPYEECQCGSACQVKCSNLGKPCDIINIACNNMCYCIAGFARNERGACIPQSLCSNCYFRYFFRYHSHVWQKVYKKKILSCISQLLYKLQKGKVVNMVRVSTILFIVIFALVHYGSATKKTPLVCDKPFEEYKCGSACQTTCANLGKPCPIVNVKCTDACYCVNGYARNTKGVCIPQSQCKKENVKI